jgi:hypothetical protein
LSRLRIGHSLLIRISFRRILFGWILLGWSRGFGWRNLRRERVPRRLVLRRRSNNEQTQENNRDKKNVTP